MSSAGDVDGRKGGGLLSRLFFSLSAPDGGLTVHLTHCCHDVDRSPFVSHCLLGRTHTHTHTQGESFTQHWSDYCSLRPLSADRETFMCKESSGFLKSWIIVGSFICYHNLMIIIDTRFILIPNLFKLTMKRR